SVIFDPLLNDSGAGERWLTTVRPTIGVGTSGQSQNGVALFPSTFRIIRATNLDPDKGELRTTTRNATVNGNRTAVLDSLLEFVPISGALGTARVEYEVEDATGQRGTETVEIVLPFRTDRLVETGHTARFTVPTNGQLETIWMEPGFSDAFWSTGPTGLGYEQSSGYEGSIATEVGGMSGVNSSVFIRIPFSVSDPGQYASLILRMKVDDGFVAYLNGTEVARLNADGAPPLAWNAASSASNPDSQAVQFANFQINDALPLLIEGTNVLAIHGMNSTVNSSDFLLVPELEATVSNDLVSISTPPVPELSLASGARLVLEGRARGTGAFSTLWRQTSGPAGGTVSFEDASSLRTTATFSRNGVYVISLNKTEGGTTDSEEITVQVGSPFSFSASGVLVDAAGDQQVPGLLANLQASVTGGPDATVEWSVLDGPGEAVFANPDRLATDVVVSQSGTYTFQLIANNGGVETTDRVEVQAGTLDTQRTTPVTITTNASSVSSGSAVLNGAVFKEGAPLLVNVTLYLGFEDGGTNPAAWTYEIPLGERSPGLISEETDNLLFNATYHYRISARAGLETVWSPEASVFT
ncbi:MAG: hypothetical protein AAF514_23425, partial [Verrucomicrobiota bacterium]